MIASRFYKGRICLNVLAKGIDNAREIYQATEGHVLVGVLSSQYETVDDAISGMKKYLEVTEGALSIGLGAGDPNQWEMVAAISRQLGAEHANQVFSGIGHTRASAKRKDIWINGLVRPTDEIGYVNIATGPLSSKGDSVKVPVANAITLIREMGGNALKFFPMQGLGTMEQYKAVAKACADADFALEPTGGIDLDNIEEIMVIALDAGVRNIIPHVYSSIIDTQTGKTRVEDVKVIYDIIQKVGNQYGS